MTKRGRCESCHKLFGRPIPPSNLSPHTEKIFCVTCLSTKVQKETSYHTWIRMERWYATFGMHFFRGISPTHVGKDEQRVRFSLRIDCPFSLFSCAHEDIIPGRVTTSAKNIRILWRRRCSGWHCVVRGVVLLKVSLARYSSHRPWNRRVFCKFLIYGSIQSPQGNKKMGRKNIDRTDHRTGGSSRHRHTLDEFSAK